MSKGALFREQLYAQSGVGGGSGCGGGTSIAV